MSKWLAPVVVLLTVLASTATASGEVEPGNIPAATIQTAYPVQPGVSYQGAFSPDTKFGYHDLDYLAFTVANPGETLEFTLQNTTQGINPAPYEWCPVYLSLLNPSNSLIADGAGTIATCNDTEVFDWTFQAPGTYYMVIESNGDMPPGDPAYAVSYRILSMGTPSLGGGPNSSSGWPQASLVRSLRVAGHQHGRSITARLTLGQVASVTESLLIRGRHRPIAWRRAALGAGSRKLVIRIPAGYRKAPKRSALSLSVYFSVRGVSGASASFTRHVSLTP